VIRFVLGELRRRTYRTLSLAGGVLVASLSFILLTAAANTSELRLRGTIARNFAGAYDILVRPAGSYGSKERSESLVAPNFASGIFGGISEFQWHEVMSIPGVEVAAPIANLGYVAPFVHVTFEIDRFLNDDAVQLYRLRSTWVAERGLSRYPGQDSFVYYTRRHRHLTPRYSVHDELMPNGDRLPVCAGFYEGAPLGGSSPFVYSTPEGWFIQCFSALSPEAARENVYRIDPGNVGSGVDVLYPVVLAAIDPQQEQALLGVEQSIVEGRYLRSSDKVSTTEGQRVVPVIAASTTYVDEPLHISVERLTIPPGRSVPRVLASPAAFDFATNLDGEKVGSLTLSSQLLFDREIESLSRTAGGLQNYWKVGPVAYRGPLDGLEPSMKENEDASYYVPCCGPLAAPGNQDVQFRLLENHKRQYFRGEPPSRFRLDIVGRFDPEGIQTFGSLVDVPLGAYTPPALLGADARSRELLRDSPLLPSMNLGGYIQQPPLILTTIDGLRFFTDPSEFEGAGPSAPISVIRVKVRGVTGPDDLSLARIRDVARMIRVRTGLSVDIVAGSSPAPAAVDLPPGRYGRPALHLREAWTKKHVAVTIIQALDRKSLFLFILVLTVTALFLLNGGLAAVRSRRSEIGTLTALGWTRGRIFGAIVAELVTIGSLAGVLGTALALVAIRAFSLRMPLIQGIMVAPIAVALTAVAGLAPAWSASRTEPVAALRPAVSSVGSPGSVRSLARMAYTNLRRLPVRTIIGATGLFIGVCALTLLLAVNWAFQGSLVGSLLGGVISIDVRAVDLASVVLALGLSALCVADVLVLNMRDRAAELVTLSATGWDDARLGFLVSLEGVGLGVLGGASGAAVGVAIAWTAGGISSKVLVAGAAAIVVSIAIALLGSFIPAMSVSRMLAPTTLAEE
jgi:ABC-type lipoprotein release transport system permease subunit